MARQFVSALVVAHNEESQLAACLDTLDFADEIVVVLDKCTDGSEAIARRYTDRLISGSWPLEGPRRRAGINACTHAWVLEIDADERVTPELQAEILRFLAAPPHGYALVPIRNFIGGREIVHGWGAYNGVGAKPILFHKDAKDWGDQPVHPKIALRGTRTRFSSGLIHYVDTDFADTLQRLNRYTSAHALDLVESGNIGTLGGNLRRMVTRFVKAYVQRKGYKEGAAGLLLGIFAALYPLLSYLKAREILERRALDRTPGLNT